MARQKMLIFYVKIIYYYYIGAICSIINNLIREYAHSPLAILHEI